MPATMRNAHLHISSLRDSTLKATKVKAMKVMLVLVEADAPTIIIKIPAPREAMVIMSSATSTRSSKTTITRPAGTTMKHKIILF